MWRFASCCSVRRRSELSRHIHKITAPLLWAQLISVRAGITLNWLRIPRFRRHAATGGWSVPDAIPKLPYDKRHDHARTASRWFSGQAVTDLGYLSACGLRKGMGYYLYSFRHTFIDLLRNSPAFNPLRLRARRWPRAPVDTPSAPGTPWMTPRRQLVWACCARPSRDAARPPTWPRT